MRSDVETREEIRANMKHIKKKTATLSFLFVPTESADVSLNAWKKQTFKLLWLICSEFQAFFSCTSMLSLQTILCSASSHLHLYFDRSASVYFGTVWRSHHRWKLHELLIFQWPMCEMISNQYFAINNAINGCWLGNFTNQFCAFYWRGLKKKSIKLLVREKAINTASICNVSRSIWQ